MGQGNGDEPLREEAWDAGLRALFGAKEVTGESVLAAIEEATGASAQVLLRDEPGDESPLLKLHPPDSEEAAKNDSRYQVVGEIARGGVGVIFKGHDRDLGRDVAIKVLRKEHAARPEIVQRFIEEAQIEGQLQHPGIIPVYGLGLQPDGRPYFAMKLVKGKTLSAHLSERKEPGEERSRYLTIFEQVCQAVAYAHARGVIHRDLKPSNILVGAFGEVLVVDWGFAKVMGTKEPEVPAPPVTIVATVRTTGEGSESIAGSVMGTPAYMPPEQALGHVEQLDTRSDVFALGAILAEILTGEPPYVGESDDQLVMASQGRLDEAYERLDACGADPEIVKLCRKCLEPLKGDRPRDASAPAMAISEHLAAQEESAREAEVDAAREKARAEEERARLAKEKLRTEAERTRATKEKRKREKERAREAKERRHVKWERVARRRTIGVAAALLLAVILGGGAFLWIQGDKRDRAERAQAAVARAVEDAERLRGEQRWPEALEKAKGAMELASVGGVSEVTRTETESLLSRVTEEKAEADRRNAQADRDRKLITSLNELRYRRAAEMDYHAFSSGYAAAFAEHGMDTEKLTAEELAGRIRTRPPEVAVELVAALDEWSWIRKQQPSLQDEDWQKLHEVARLADPDPWSARLREAAPARDTETLRSMADEALQGNRPIRKLHLLVVALEDAAAQDRAIELALEAHRLHPDDPWLNSLLVNLFCHCKPPRGEEACRFATATVALQPESPGPWVVLSFALQAADRFEEALDAARRAETLASESPRVLVTVANAHLRLGNLDDAERALHRALEIDRDLPGAHCGLGHVLWKRGEIDGAIAAFREGIRRTPRHAAAHLNLGVLYKEQGRAEEAIREYRLAIKYLPDYPLAYSNLGNALLDLEPPDLVRAEAAYKRAIELDDECVYAHQNYSSFLRKRGKVKEAIDHARTAIAIDPKFGPAHTSLILAFEAAGEPEKKIQACHEALAVIPDHERAHFKLGVLLAERGDHGEAIEHYRKTVAVSGEDECQAWNNMGFSLIEQGRLDEAFDAFQKSLRVDRDFCNAWMGLAWVHYRRDEPDEALGAIDRALGLRPDWGACHRTHGFVLLGNGDLDGAVEAWQKAVRLMPVPQFYVNLSWGLMAKGNLDGAIEQAREAIRRKRPGTPDGHHQLGFLLTMYGDAEGAEREYREAIRLGAPDPSLHCWLSYRLLMRGKVVEAAKAKRRGHELGSKREDWPHASGRWASDYERAAKLAPQLPEILRGERKPGDADEAVAHALLFQSAGHFVSAARMWEIALDTAPELAATPGIQYRSDAASIAASALAGKGEESPSDEEREHLSRLARRWLEAELEAARAFERKDLRQVIEKVSVMKVNSMLAGVRNPDKLSDLSSAEREAWQAFWKRVDRVFIEILEGR